MNNWTRIIFSFRYFNIVLCAWVFLKQNTVKRRKISAVYSWKMQVELVHLNNSYFILKGGFSGFILAQYFLISFQNDWILSWSRLMVRCVFLLTGLKKTIKLNLWVLRRANDTFKIILLLFLTNINKKKTFTFTKVTSSGLTLLLELMNQAVNLDNLCPESYAKF